MDDNIEDAAYDIIYGDLIPHNIGNMSEDERQGLISLGMEKAKYLADNHLNGDQAKQFMEAMETIEVEEIYNNTDRSNIQGFVDSIISQDTLFSSKFLEDSLAKFAEHLK